MGVAMVLAIVLGALLLGALVLWGGLSILTGTLRKLWRAILSNEP